MRGGMAIESEPSLERGVRVKLDPPYDRTPYGGSGSLVTAHALPLGMATAEGSLVGVQLDLETRQASTKGRARDPESTRVLDL